MKLDGAKSSMKFTAEGDELSTKLIAKFYFVIRADKAQRTETKTNAIPAPSC